MADIAIRASNISKRYEIGAAKERHADLRELLATRLSRVLSWRAGALAHQAAATEHWALKDVCFEIKQGDVVGLIGRNGSGKSTLLKILSGITEPTEGRVDVRGQVGSLLEVGTGFHPELTGRENIYLSGAIHGMRKAEIDKKFDEIVDFSGIEKFIDTPVKRYSSGMYVRLGFALAAHLEPAILIVDEVLAVGDTNFQKRCLKKMEDVGHQGRTVILVSHNMPAISRLCRSAILLEQGCVKATRGTHEIVNAYLSSGVSTWAEREWKDPETAPGSDVVRLCGVRVRGEDGRPTDVVDIRRPVCLEMEYEVLKAGYVLIPHFSIHNEEGLQLFSAIDCDPDWQGKFRARGCYRTAGWIPGNLLADGTIIVGAAMNTLSPNIMHFYANEAVAFRVVDSYDGDAARGEFPMMVNGVVRPMLKWTTWYGDGAFSQGEAGKT